MKLSREESARRKYVWRHNSYFGHARMMLVQSRAIIDSPSTSFTAKMKATKINQLADELIEALKERIDP